MIDLGAEYLDVREVLEYAPALELTATQADQLEIAVESALITLYRTDKPNRRSRRVAKIAGDLFREAQQIYSALHFLLTQRDVVSVNIANGRFPSQKMAQLAAEARNVPTIHFEKGETPSGAYVQPYAPQNRLMSQGAVDGVLSGLTQHQIVETADTWLARRAPATSSSNGFSANWIDAVPEALLRRPKSQITVGFFTSSQDEFLFLGPEWHLHRWESQFQAFDQLLTYFEQRDAQCFLRVHPNLATKEHECFLRERANLRLLAEKHPNLIVISHDNPISSYALLDVSTAIVVWYSTIGLEASARGIPVWTCAASRYGEVADIREVFGPEDLTAKKMTPWKVNSLGAKKFIAYLVNRDRHVDLTRPGWETWDTQNPPKALKLAALLVSGGSPSIRDALVATVDAWRHRSLKFNRASLRAKMRQSAR